MNLECGHIAHKPRISLLDLPDELLLRILGDNSLDGYEGSSATRGSFMLVNRRLGALATEVQYRNLVFSQFYRRTQQLWEQNGGSINGGWNFNNFAHTINECPHYADLVRHINLSWYNQDQDLPISKVLEKLRWLQSLSLSGPSYGRPLPPLKVTGPSAFTFLEQNPMPCLQKLFSANIRYDDVDKFMFLPNLKTVGACRFDSNPGYQQPTQGIGSSRSPGGETRSSPVEHIELQRVDLYDPELPTFLYCFRYLKVLKISGHGINANVFSPAKLQSLLEPLRQSLVELHACHFPEDTCRAKGDGTQMDLGGFTAMRVLVVPSILVHRNDQPWCQAKLYERLPPNLEVLKINVGKASNSPLSASGKAGSIPELYSWLPKFGKHMATYLPRLRHVETREHSCDFCGWGIGRYRWSPPETVVRTFEDANVALDVA